MKILRVFPRRTAYTPTDDLAFVGEPPLPGFRPENVDAIHVSVTFTWDIQKAGELANAWADAYPGVMVSLGGPAYDSKPNGFIPGQYVRSGVTFTTRGCNRHCPWCLVPEREGRLREFADFAAGNIVQDNNVLQASPSHWQAVCAMLRTQSAITFSGGLDARLITDAVADDLRGLRIDQLFLAADTDGSLPTLRRALGRLHSFSRRKLRVYVMVGYNGETLEQAERRLEAVWSAGGLPFCQLYQPPDRWIEYPDEWKHLRRSWSRPAAMFAMHTKEACHRDRP